MLARLHLRGPVEEAVYRLEERPDGLSWGTHSSFAAGADSAFVDVNVAPDARACYRVVRQQLS